MGSGIQIQDNKQTGPFIEVSNRLAICHHTTTTRRTPAHLGLEGDEVADVWARAAVENIYHRRSGKKLPAGGRLPIHSEEHDGG